MSAEDSLFRSLRRHSRLRVDRLAEDLTSRDLVLSDIHCSLQALEAGQNALRRGRRAATLEGSSQLSAPLESGPAAHEISASWIAEEERAAKQGQSLQMDSTPTQGIKQCGVLRGSSLGNRRRQRYRTLPGTVRRVAANSADDLSEDAVDVVGQPMEDQHDAEGDGMMNQQLLQFRRVRAKGVASSTAEYLRLEAESTTAVLLCRAVTTAEQERRTKQRARVWRQDLGKLKARHARTQDSIDQFYEKCPVPYETAGKLSGALLGHDRTSLDGVDDDGTAHHDMLEDSVYENLLKENLASSAQARNMDVESKEV